LTISSINPDRQSKGDLSMRIAIIAVGTRGDIQPYLALGKGLQSAGHFVRLITHENFAGLVGAYGLDFWPVQGNVQAMMESPKMRQLLAEGNFFAITAYTAKGVKQAAIDWAKTGLVACEGMDLIVAGVGGLYVGLALYIGFALAEKLQIPFVQAYIFPFTATRAFPGILLPQALTKLGGAFNRFSHHLLRQLMWQKFQQIDRLVRQTVLNLPAAPFWGSYNLANFQRYPVIYGFSPAVIAPPDDWHHTNVTGYWLLDAAPDWTPPADLVDFLQAGSPPVYIGFGSMGSDDPTATADLILQALDRTGQRAILQSGWGGLSTTTLPETVFVVGSIPHDWLFSQMAAIIHHGGAGTTAASLTAGVPTIAIPFFADQPFWGQRVFELGVGPKPIPRKQLTVENLAQAIDRAVTDPFLRQRAADLGAKIQAENGIANAVKAIESLAEPSLGEIGNR
jgi:sterol 3beta-glucosyltransferase